MDFAPDREEAHARVEGAGTRGDVASFNAEKRGLDQMAAMANREQQATYEGSPVLGVMRDIGQGVVNVARNVAGGAINAQRLEEQLQNRSSRTDSA